MCNRLLHDISVLALEQLRTLKPDTLQLYNRSLSFLSLLASTGEKQIRTKFKGMCGKNDLPDDIATGRLAKKAAG